MDAVTLSPPDAQTQANEALARRIHDVYKYTDGGLSGFFRKAEKEQMENEEYFDRIRENALKEVSGKLRLFSHLKDADT